MGAAQRPGAGARGRRSVCGRWVGGVGLGGDGGALGMACGIWLTGLRAWHTPPSVPARHASLLPGTLPSLLTVPPTQTDPPPPARRQREQRGAPARPAQRRQPGAGGRGPDVLRQPFQVWRPGWQWGRRAAAAPAGCVGSPRWRGRAGSGLRCRLIQPPPQAARPLHCHAAHASRQRGGWLPRRCRHRGTAVGAGGAVPRAGR